MKKLLSFFVSLTMILSSVTGVVFAEDTENGVEFFDAVNDAKITEISGEENLYAKIIFDADKSGTANVIAARYSDAGALLNMEVVDEITISEIGSISYTTPLFSVSGTDELKIFVWDSLDGLVPLLKNPGVIRRTADSFADITKFTGKTDASYITDTTVKVGELFDEVEGIKPAVDCDNVQITVTNASGDAAGTYTADTSDWKNGTIAFTGIGDVSVSITDNYYCTPTVIGVTIEDYPTVDKFAAKENLTFERKKQSEAIVISLGDVFEEVAGALIDSANVTVNVDGEDCVYTSDATDWTKGTLSFTGTGDVKISITDNDYCNTAVATVKITEPEMADKFIPNDNLTFTHTVEGGTITKTLGELFTVAENAEIDTDGIEVEITGDNIYTYTENTNWADSTIEFKGTGAVSVTITDNNFCNDAVAAVAITVPDAVEKFKAKDNLTFTHTVEGGTIEKTVGDVLEAVSDDIYTDKIEITVSGNCEYTPGATWDKGTLKFTETGTVLITITDNNFCKQTTATVTVQNPASVDKFTTKFENSDDYLYRVGNQNTVALGSLFEALDGAEIGNVTVTVEALNNSNVKAEYTANTADWTKGTIQFSGAGVVKIIIDDDKYANEYALNVEVINAKNITKAESATANDVVLLNNTSGSFTVSGGHTFYGNGFEVKLPSTSVKNVGNGFTGYVNIGGTQDDGNANGGNLDNVRIIGPVYPEMYIYRDQAKITDSSDPDYGDGYNMRYFVNSVIVYGGNCTISNSYISGSRTALCLRGGNNVVIENTTLSGGAYANMQICAGSSVILRDLTTVQTDVSDSYGKGKTAHGLGIAVDSDVVDVYIEGELKQYNWLNQSKWNSIVPSNYQSTFPSFFTNSTFNKYWHYLNDGTDPYVNLAFIYACNWNTSRIHDNRTTVDYGTTDASIAGVSGGVYSKINTVGGNAITDAEIEGPEYASSGFNPVAPVFGFDNSPNNDDDDANDANDAYCVYNEGTGTLKIGLTGTSKTLDLSAVKILKDGNELAYKKFLNGKEVSGNSITVNAADGAKQTLVFKAKTNDCGYDKDGNPISGEIEYTWTVTLEVATLKFPAPVWNMGENYTFDAKTYGRYPYYGTSNGYGEAVQIYEGIKINYYNKNGELVNLDLSGTTTHPTGSANSNSNAFTYTLSDGSTLTMKFSSGWKTGATTHQFTTYENKVYIYPQSLDNDNYIRAKVTNQDFDVKITYTFTDPNGQSVGPQTMQWYNAKASNGNVKTVQWKTFDSKNGKEPSVCVTGDTLITLADGSKKQVKDLTGEEELLVWNHVTGEFNTAPTAYIVNHDGEEIETEVITLYFEDGKKIDIIEEHVFFDRTLNKYVALGENAVDNVGHEFSVVTDGELTTAKLVKVESKIKKTDIYEVVSFKYINCLTNDILSTSAYLDPIMNVFDIEPGTMKYINMEEDIAQYGLYTYEDFAELIPEKAFEMYNGAYLKVAVGKGYITWNDILDLIGIYDEVEVEPLQ